MGGHERTATRNTSVRRQAARAALALAAVMGLVLVRQLYTSGAPLLWLPRPAIYLPAVMGSLALAAWGALAGPRRAPIVAASLALAVYLSNARLIASGDTHGAALLPYNIVRRGSFSLDGLAPSPRPYWVIERGGRAWSRYPVTAAVMALPVYLPVAMGGGHPGALPHAEKLSAALLCAISVGFVLAALRLAGAPEWLAAAGTALYALGSPVLSSASQALWQHGPGLLAVSGALWAALRAREDSRFDLLAGAFCGLAVAARPTDAVRELAVLAATAARGPGALARALACAVPPLALVAAYHAAAFGSLWATGYGAEASAFTTPLGLGLRGVLFSPTRGLLAFVPWVALAAFGLARGARRDPLHASVAVAAAATILLYAKWHAWWGGWCYGPRLVSDLMPVLALGLAPLATVPRRLLIPALVLTGALAIGLNGLGAFASRSAAGRSVYDADDPALAMEGWRWPPAGLVEAARR